MAWWASVSKLNACILQDLPKEWWRLSDRKSRGREYIWYDSWEHLFHDDLYWHLYRFLVRESVIYSPHWNARSQCHWDDSSLYSDRSDAVTSCSNKEALTSNSSSMWKKHAHPRKLGACHPSLPGEAFTGYFGPQLQVHFQFCTTELVVLKQLAIHNINTLFIKHRGTNQHTQSSQLPETQIQSKMAKMLPNSFQGREKTHGWGLKVNRRAAHQPTRCQLLFRHLGFLSRILTENSKWDLGLCWGSFSQPQRASWDYVCKGKYNKGGGKSKKQNDMKSLGMNICKVMDILWEEKIIVAW